MIGPPGAGKSMLALRLPGLLPPLTPSEVLEVSMIQSVAGQLLDGGLTRRRPFRWPARCVNASRSKRARHPQRRRAARSRA